MRKHTPFDRWNTKVDRTDSCWWWRGAIKETGYGVLQRGGRGEGLIRAHRFAYEHFKGPIPAGLDVRHLCHNRACVNPDHLDVGTRKENMADMIAAGRGVWRGAKGEANGLSKITDDDVRRIRTSSETGRQIARDLGVSESLVSLVRRGKTWRHVSP